MQTSSSINYFYIHWNCHCRWPHTAPWVWESWPLWRGPRTAGYSRYLRGKVPVTQTGQLTYHSDPNPRSSVGPLYHLPFMICWSAWRNWSYWKITAASPWPQATAGCWRGVWVSFLWWWCNRALEPKQWLIAMNSLWVRLIGQKVHCFTLQHPTPLGWMKRCWKDGNQGVFLVYVFFYFWLICEGSLGGVLPGWGEDMNSHLSLLFPIS